MLLISTSDDGNTADEAKLSFGLSQGKGVC